MVTSTCSGAETKHRVPSAQEALESLLGKAYFGLMCARWAALFFWEDSDGSSSPTRNRLPEWANTFGANGAIQQTPLPEPRYSLCADGGWLGKQPEICSRWFTRFFQIITDLFEMDLQSKQHVT